MTPVDGIVVFCADEHRYNRGEVSRHIEAGLIVCIYTDVDKPTFNGRLPAAPCADEIQRFKTFISPRAGAHFLRGRMLLRSILQDYLQVSEATLKVTCKPNLKPHIQCAHNHRETPQFSLSYSDEWVLLAIHRSMQIGADIECKPSCPIDEIADLPDLLTSAEKARLASTASKEARTDLFLQIWRRKEAVMKATGLGFGLDPASIETVNEAGELYRTLTAAGQRLWLSDQNIAPDLDCALAVQLPYTANHPPTTGAS